jgi:tRNA 2-selenouridine synthase
VRGRETVQGWQAMARAGRWAEVFSDLMLRHYDPLYGRSLERQLKGLNHAHTVELADGREETLHQVARRLIDALGHTQAVTS